MRTMKARCDDMNTKTFQGFVKMLIKMLKKKVPPDEIIEYLESFLE
ncbi:MAG: hypothetical protein ACI4EE_14220 [Lachnospiraceae bacterium]